MARNEHTGARRRQPGWDATSVRGLRRHLALTQEELAEELGVRQQTVSEWETGSYRPRGASERVLMMVAERAGYPYDAAPAGRAATPAAGLPGEAGRRVPDAVPANPVPATKRRAGKRAGRRRRPA